MRIFHEALEKARFRGVVKKSGFLVCRYSQNWIYRNP